MCELNQIWSLQFDCHLTKRSRFQLHITGVTLHWGTDCFRCLASHIHVSFLFSPTLPLSVTHNSFLRAVEMTRQPPPHQRSLCSFETRRSWLHHQHPSPPSPSFLFFPHPFKYDSGTSHRLILGFEQPVLHSSFPSFPSFPDDALHLHWSLRCLFGNRRGSV